MTCGGSKYWSPTPKLGRATWLPLQAAEPRASETGASPIRCRNARPPLPAARRNSGRRTCESREPEGDGSEPTAHEERRKEEDREGVGRRGSTRQGPRPLLGGRTPTFSLQLLP